MNGVMELLNEGKVRIEKEAFNETIKELQAALTEKKLLLFTPMPNTLLFGMGRT